MIYKETVKKIRHEMLLTKEDFTKLLNVSLTTINRWGNGYFNLIMLIKVKLEKIF